MFSCFSVFSLGTALLYRTVVCAATMYAQNGGKAFAQAPAAVSTCGKAGQKNMPLFFTWRENCPKGLFRRWAERQKPRALFQRMLGAKGSAGQTVVRGRQGLGGCIAAILLDKEQRLADAVDDDLQHRRLTIPVSFLDFCIGEVQPQIFSSVAKGLPNSVSETKKVPAGDTCFSFASPTEAWNMSPYCPPCQLPPPAS